MAIINGEGKSISYECNELIAELKEDIKEFGGDKVVAVWKKKMHGVTVYTNYDFIEDEPLAPEELAESESVGQMTMAALLEALEAQNSLI